MFREDTYNFCRGFCTLVLFIILAHLSVFFQGLVGSMEQSFAVVTAKARGSTSPTDRWVQASFSKSSQRVATAVERGTSFGRRIAAKSARGNASLKLTRN